MKRIFLTTLSFIILTTLSACGNASTETTTPAQNAQASAIINEVASKQAILLDVRTADEYKAGHVKDAVLLPYDEIEPKIAQVAPDKNQKIYVYCRSGRRSGIAEQTLKGLGYSNITNLGGLSDLKKYGLSSEP